MQKDATIKGKSLQSSDDNVADVADAVNVHEFLDVYFSGVDAAIKDAIVKIVNKMQANGRHLTREEIWKIATDAAVEGDAADLKKQYKSFCGQDVTIPVHESNILVSHIDMDLAKIITIDGYVPPRKYVGIYKQDVTNKLSDMTTNGGK